MTVSVSDTKNIETFRKAINRSLPGYGDTLPDADKTEDGRIFVVSGVIHQLQDGAWVAL